MQKKIIKIVKREEKAVTLIELTITIVVLIILAVVSINMLFGDNGIIQEAEHVKNTQTDEGEKEQDLFNAVSDYVDTGYKEVIKQKTSGTRYSDVIKIGDMQILIDASNKLWTENSAAEISQMQSVKIESNRIFDIGISMGASSGSVLMGIDENNNAYRIQNKSEGLLYGKLEDLSAIFKLEANGKFYTSLKGDGTWTQAPAYNVGDLTMYIYNYDSGKLVLWENTNGDILNYDKSKNQYKDIKKYTITTNLTKTQSDNIVVMAGLTEEGKTIAFVKKYEKHYIDEEGNIWEVQEKVQE